MNVVIKIILVAQHPYSGVGRLTVEVTRSHTQTYTVTLGRTLLDEGSARRGDLYLPTHNVHKNIHATCGIRTHNPSKRAAAELRLRPCCHWDWAIRNNC
jgi:hypothetical protein